MFLLIKNTPIYEQEHPYISTDRNNPLSLRIGNVPTDLTGVFTDEA